MKKITVWLIGMLVLLLAACGGGGSSASEGASEESGDKVVLQLGHALPADHSVDKASKKFAELVDEKSDGEIEIQVFPAAQLGNEREMLEQLSIGAQDMGALVAGAHSSLVPEFGVNSGVYMYRDREHAEKVMHGEIGNELSEKMLNEQNIRIIDPYWYYGSRNLTANEPIMTPDELEGKKIRVPELEIQVEGLKFMGAEATPVDFNELYMALQTGVVEGQENPATTIESSAFYEVQDYFMRTNHIIAHFMVSIAEPVFQELTEEQQNIIMEAAAEAGEYNDELTVQEEEDSIAALEENGMEIVEPNIEEFSKAGAKLAEKYREEWGDLYERIQAVE